MVIEYPINRHKILIYLYIEEVKKKKGNLVDIQNLLHLTRNCIASMLSQLKRRRYIDYEKTSAIELTNRGFDMARYFYVTPERYNLVKWKKELIMRAAMEGYVIEYSNKEMHSFNQP